VLRRVLSWGFRTWVGFCLGLGDLGDTQCGLKGFRADVARAVFQDLATSGFAFDTEILARARLRGDAIVPVAVTLRPVLGTSIHVLRDSVRMFVEVWRQRSIVKRLRARA
jgi:dolichyl-phosphate beta-glucosyltransferase